MGLFSFFSSAPAKTLVLGDSIPAVTAPDQDGNEVNLQAEPAAGFTLVYFYPKAGTPGCTAQACSLRDAFADLTGRGVHVFGVSTDGIKAQKRFQTRYRLPFRLLADTNSQIRKAFGVSSILGLAARSTFLFENGRLVWKEMKASTHQQAHDVLAFLSKDQPLG